MPKKTNNKRTAKTTAAKTTIAKKVAKATAATAKAGPAKKVAKAATAKKAPAKKVAKAATAKNANAKKVAKAANAKKVAKAATAKKVAKASTAKKVAKASTAKKVAKAAPAKKVAKAAAAKAPAKKVAKAAAAKVPAKKVAKAAAAKVTAKLPAKKVAKAAASTGGGVASWIARLDAKIAELRASSGAKVLAVWRGDPISSETIKEIEAKVGALDAGIRDFYAQANGLGLVWVLADAHVRGSLKEDGRPSMRELEDLPPSAGVIALIPLEEVFGLTEAPFFDYAEFMPASSPHWGFDFPGNFYTPAFVREGDALTVKVGDDHGAAWDGKAVSFEQYLEGVLATWGLVNARADVFIHGKGRARPMTLAQALAEAQRNEP